MVTTLPLCVDLDGTLIRSDSLHESLIKAIKVAPIRTASAFGKLSTGKAEFKNAIAQITDLDVTSLPYNIELLDYLKEQRKDRQIILVTGANQRIAESVNSHLGAFDEVLASDGHNNLTGENKKKALEKIYGNKGFDYIGNESADFPVWSAARQASVVTDDETFADSVREQFITDKIFKVQGPTVTSWMKFARIHQWSKNLLLLVPFFLDHRFSQWSDLVTVGLAFLAFSLLASMTYMVNDMLDIEADRRNSTKSRRGLASGAINVRQALVAILSLISCVFILCLFLPLPFNLALAAYFVLTMLYSFVLKKMLMLDVCVLAILHTMRIIAGTLAISAQWSFWLLAFSMFFFLSLAIAKRVSELSNAKKENKGDPTSRGYKLTDIDILNSAGIGAGYISILVIALYINSSKVSSIYRVPEILWLICPLLLYWIGRLWVITARGEMHEDPIVFALRDRTSIVILAGIAFVFSLAVLA